MEEYFRAKLALFHPDVARRGVVSLDTSWGHRIAAESHIPVTTISSQGDESAYWQVDVTEDNADYTAFTLRSADGIAISTREPVIGRHMAANAALAMVMLIEAGYDPDTIAGAL
jgi:UDP-N-acetylmuramoyl-L-alanyl-D-glutamate--2,6-diaminopimelate ligase